MSTSVDDMLRSLVSERTGLLRRVELQRVAPGSPGIFWAKAEACDTTPLFGHRALNNGLAASFELDAVYAKAVGESVERYCAASSNMHAIFVAPYSALSDVGVPPSSFILYSDSQYSEAGQPLRFSKAGDHTPLSWVKGTCLVDGSEILIPAQLVFIPFAPRAEDGEPPLAPQISTGLACGQSLEHALYRGLMEVIERDAFSLWWRLQINYPNLDWSTISDPDIHRALDELSDSGIKAVAVSLQNDLAIPVYLVALFGDGHRFPRAVVGASAGYDVQCTVRSAFEEACLGLLAMPFLMRTLSDTTRADLSHPSDLHAHALSHAVIQSHADAVFDLATRGDVVAINDRAGGGTDAECLRRAVAELVAHDYRPCAVSLTTTDISTVGLEAVSRFRPFQRASIATPSFHPTAVRLLHSNPVISEG